MLKTITKPFLYMLLGSLIVLASIGVKSLIFDQNKEVETIELASPTITPLPTVEPTQVPTIKVNTYQAPAKAEPTAVPQRVAIYVASANQTVQCVQVNSSSAIELVKKIDQYRADSDNCFNDRRSAFTECATYKTNCIDLDAKWKECEAIETKRSQAIDALNQMCE